MQTHTHRDPQNIAGSARCRTLLREILRVLHNRRLFCEHIESRAAQQEVDVIQRAAALVRDEQGHNEPWILPPQKA